MIACKGEMVTCENGHEICEVAQDLGRYFGATVEMFAAWRIEMSSEGDQLMRHCAICGAEFMRPMSKEPAPPQRTGLRCFRPWLTEAEFAYMARGLQLHIGNEWRR